MPYSSGMNPWAVVASPMAVPALIWIGVTSGSRALSCRPAWSTASQLSGCQLAGRLALANSFLLKNRTRPSVPTGMP